MAPPLALGMGLGPSLAPAPLDAAPAGPSLGDYVANGVSLALLADFQEDIYLGPISSFDDFTATNTAFDTVVGQRRLLVDTTAGAALALAANKLPSVAGPITIVVVGEITYADNNNASEAVFWWWPATDYVRGYFTTVGGSTGSISSWNSGGGLNFAASETGFSLTPGTNVPFGAGARYGVGFHQAALNGRAGAAAAPSAMPNLANTPLQFVTVGVVRLRALMIFTEDPGEAGLEEAASPSFFT